MKKIDISKLDVRVLIVDQCGLVDFIELNSNLDWDAAIELADGHYFDEERVFCPMQTEPNQKMIKDHGCDWVYEFFNAHDIQSDIVFEFTD